MEKNNISKWFLIFLIIAVLYLCYLIFKPFMVIILVATILVTIFYSPYEHLAKLLRGRKQIASLIMCILIALVVILPIVNFIAYAAQRSTDAFVTTKQYIESRDIGRIVESGKFERFNVIGLSRETVKKTLIDVANDVKNWLAAGAGNFIVGTTNFVISFFLIFFTMYFFFVDGKSMLQKVMYWTPLPNKYDKEIFQKFKDVSLTTIITTFATALVQGLIGGIGFLIVGLPAFFAGIAMGFTSLLPYIGSGLVWFPTAIYLLFVGKIWQGVFLLVWGFGVVGVSDNLTRGYLIKGKAQVHPIFVIFSIFGGITLFGFWGVIFGPLIISLAVTILHIYEMEYEIVLER